MNYNNEDELTLEEEFNKALHEMNPPMVIQRTLENRGHILMLTREALHAGRIDLLEAGNIERAVNKGYPLSKAQKEAISEKKFEKSFDAFIQREETGYVSKTEALQKAQATFKSGRIDLIESGNIEREINHGMLSKAHRATLGLTQAIIEGQHDCNPSACNLTDLRTGAPEPSFDRNFQSIQEIMNAPKTREYSFENVQGSMVTVSGSEILSAVSACVRKGKLSLEVASKIERILNKGKMIPLEILRMLFK